MSKWISAAAVLLLPTLLGANIFLLHQNYALKAQASKPPPQWSLAVGQLMPPIEGADMAGSAVKIGWGEDKRDTFLFVFSPHCAVCRLTWPAWREMAKSSNSNAHRLAYVDSAERPTQDFVEKNGIASSLLIAEIDPKSLVAYHLRMTPEVIQLGPDGRVAHVWIGGFSENEDFSSLRTALGYCYPNNGPGICMNTN